MLPGQGRRILGRAKVTNEARGRRQGVAGISVYEIGPEEVLAKPQILPHSRINFAKAIQTRTDPRQHLSCPIGSHCSRQSCRLISKLLQRSRDVLEPRFVELTWRQIRLLCRAELGERGDHGIELPSDRALLFECGVALLLTGLKKTSGAESNDDEYDEEGNADDPMQHPLTNIAGQSRNVKGSSAPP